MNAFLNLFAHNRPNAAVPDDVEKAVSNVMREADELCRLLRSHRETCGPNAHGPLSSAE